MGVADQAVQDSIGSLSRSCEPHESTGQGCQPFRQAVVQRRSGPPVQLGLSLPIFPAPHPGHPAKGGPGLG